MDDTPELSVLLLGDASVGKSTFISRLTVGHQARGPLPALKDLDQPFPFDVRKGRRSVRLEFYDTASPTSYVLLKPDVVVLCFSIADPASLISLQTMWRKVVETHFNHDERLPVIVLGLQRDVRTRADYDGKIRLSTIRDCRGNEAAGPPIVYPQQGLNIAQALRCDRYCECSALTGDLCREVFEDIAQTAILTTTEEGGRTPGTNCQLM